MAAGAQLLDPGQQRRRDRLREQAALGGHVPLMDTVEVGGLVRVGPAAMPTPHTRADRHVPACALVDGD
jgi:hypothetical protein